MMNQHYSGYKKSIVYLLPLLFLLAAFILIAVNRGYSDYASYYFGSKLILFGKYQDVYENISFNQAISNLGYHGLFVSYTPFPPFNAILFAPFTILPIGISKIAFTVLSAICFVITLQRSFKYFSIHPNYLLLIPLIFFSAIKNNILFGQSYLLLFSMLMEGYMAFEKNQKVYCSFLWGTAILFKVFPIFILFFLLLKKQYKQALYLVAACIILLIFSILINGFEVWNYYLTGLFPRLSNGELNDSFTYLFQTAHMFFKGIFIYDRLLNPKVYYHSPLLFLLSIALFKALIISSSVMITRQKNANWFLIFACWIFAGMLVSPNGSTYSLILLLPIFIGLSTLKLSEDKMILLVIILFLIVNIPLNTFHETLVFFKFPRLYLMLFLYSIMLFYLDLKFKLKTGLLFTGLFFSLDVWKLSSLSVTDNSSYMLNMESHLLIYDYSISNQKLTYKYWSEQGPSEEQTEIQVSTFDDNEIEIKNGQIFFQGNELTHSNDKKLKPLIVNKDYILYLSDKNRGIGMYTLRKIKLP